MKRRGFTIIEMLVAIGLLSALLAGSAVIFSVSVQAQRTAKATSQISRRLRAITDQLNADFAGLRRDAPLAVWFEAEFVSTGLPAPDDWIINRHDQILFFADGDFQTTRQYVNGTISGNVARIYYGQADEIDYASRTITDKEVVNEYKTFNTLARRQHILTGDVLDDDAVFPNPADFVKTFVPFYDNGTEIVGNDVLEYDTVPLSWWQAAGNDRDLNNKLIETCFDNINGRAGIDFAAGQTLHMLMLEGVGSFEIQWWSAPVGQWLPGTDPDDELGYYFNMAGGVSVANWNFSPVFPRALKFTFTLYDSLGIYEDGKRFTHIVYLDN